MARPVVNHFQPENLRSSTPAEAVFIGALVARQRTLALNTTAMARRLGVSPALWRLTRLGAKPLGWKLFLAGASLVDYEASRAAEQSLLQRARKRGGQRAPGEESAA